MKKQLVKIKLDGEIYYAVKRTFTTKFLFFIIDEYSQYKDLRSYQIGDGDSYWWPKTSSYFRTECLTKESALAALAYFDLPGKPKIIEKVIG